MIHVRSRAFLIALAFCIGFWIALYQWKGIEGCVVGVICFAALFALLLLRAQPAVTEEDA